MFYPFFEFVNCPQQKAWEESSETHSTCSISPKLIALSHASLGSMQFQFEQPTSSISTYLFFKQVSETRKMQFSTEVLAISKSCFPNPARGSHGHVLHQFSL